LIVRFQADQNLNQHIVSGVLQRVPEISFQTAQQAELSGLSDIEVLARAAAQDRILVTHDRRTMPFHFADFIKKNSSPGVFSIPRRAKVRTIIEELILIWSASESEDYINRFVTLPL